MPTAKQKRQNKKRRKRIKKTNLARNVLAKEYAEKFTEVDESHLCFEKFLKEKSNDYDSLTIEMSKYDDLVKEFMSLKTDDEKLEWIQKNCRDLV